MYELNIGLGDFVLVKEKWKKKQKLCPIWTGPHRINGVKLNLFRDRRIILYSAETHDKRVDKTIYSMPSKKRSLIKFVR